MDETKKQTYYLWNCWIDLKIIQNLQFCEIKAAYEKYDRIGNEKSRYYCEIKNNIYVYAYVNTATIV